jgi:hypothetical protein
MFPRTFHRIVAVSAMVCIAHGQSAAGEPKAAATPVPELQKLAPSIGLWKTTQRSRSATDASVFESTSTENVRWSEDKQYVISEQCGLTLSGWTSRILVTSWNPADRQIHVVEVSQGGATIDLTLWFEGDVQKVLGHRRFGERLVRTELTVEHTSPDEYKFRVDCLDSDKAWVCSEGVSQRVK